MRMFQRLPEQLFWRVPPIRGHQIESLGSWLFRLGQANGLPDLTSFLMELDFTEHVYAGRLDCSDHPEGVVASIAHASSQAPEVVQSLLLNEPLTRFGGEKVDGVNRWAVRSIVRQNRGFGMAFNVCPHCIRESTEPWWPRGWRMAVMTECPIHHVLLQNSCTRCGHPFLIHSRRTASLHLCEKCNLELADMVLPTYPEPGPAAGFVRYLLWDAESAGHLPDQQVAWQCIRKLLRLISHPAWANSLIRGMLPDQFANLLTRIAQSGPRSFYAWSVYERHQALRFVEWLMGDWPGRLVDMLRRSQLATSQLRFLRSGRVDWVSQALWEHLPDARLRRRSTSMTYTHLPQDVGDDTFARFATPPPAWYLFPPVARPFKARRRSTQHG